MSDILQQSLKPRKMKFNRLKDILEKNKVGVIDHSNINIYCKGNNKDLMGQNKDNLKLGLKQKRLKTLYKQFNWCDSYNQKGLDIDRFNNFKFKKEQKFTLQKKTFDIIARSVLIGPRYPRRIVLRKKYNKLMYFKPFEDNIQCKSLSEISELSEESRKNTKTQSKNESNQEKNVYTDKTTSFQKISDTNLIQENKDSTCISINSPNQNISNLSSKISQEIEVYSINDSNISFENYNDSKIINNINSDIESVYLS